MMLWWSKRPSREVDGFAYFLAHQLHKTVKEIESMPHAEYVNWAAYFTAKQAVENMRPLGPGL